MLVRSMFGSPPRLRQNGNVHLIAVLLARKLRQSWPTPRKCTLRPFSFLHGKFTKLTKAKWI